MRKILLALTIIANCLIGKAQVTLILQPDGCAGKDAVIPGGFPNSNGGALPFFDAYAWTCGGNPCYAKGLIRFDLSYIPQGSVINSAYLSLYADTNATDGYTGTPMWGTDNACHLKRVTSYWNEDSVTWNTQPTSDTTGQVLLPQSTSTTQNYPNIDIKGFVQYWNQNPTMNFGMVLEMITANHYNSLIFCSSDYPDSTKRPKLVITYTPPLNACISIQPDGCAGKDAGISSGFPDGNGGTAPYFDAYAWTCGGNPCFTKGLFKFDLSYIPQGSVITSAYLSLYADTNSTDCYTGTPMWGTNNACHLKRVTSYWNEDSVTWNTQPTTDTTGQVLLPQSTSTTQNYLNINIKGFVQYWMQNPGMNYGMELEMITTNHYNSLIFCSSDYPDSSKRPKLDICFSVPSGINELSAVGSFKIFPNPSTGILNVDCAGLQAESVSIYSADGKLLLKVQQPSGNRVAADNLAAGIYIAEIKVKDTMQRVRWMKM